MQSRISRNKFIDQIFISLAICDVCTGIFWCCFSANQNAKDLFSIIGGFITIIGFYIAIKQLAQLRNEKEIIHDTRVLDKLDDIKDNLSEIINNLSENIDSYIINNCIDNLKRVQKKVNEIKAEQCKYFDCSEFRNSLNSIIEDLRNSSKTEDNIKIFNSVLFIERTTALIDIVSEAKKDVTENIG